METALNGALILDTIRMQFLGLHFKMTVAQATRLQA
jgi:hypothetical protein